MRILSLLIKIFIGILLALFLLVFIIRSPWGQNIIKGYTVSYLSEKTKTTIQLDRLYLTFAGNVAVEGLYIEDLQGDTLLFSHSLTAHIPIWPALAGKGISINQLGWEGARVNINRRDSIRGFNYQFLIDAFVDPNVPSRDIADTASADLNLAIGNINLSDIKANYQDEIAGLFGELDIGSLSVHMNDADFEKMHFDVGDVHLKNSRFEYFQSKPFLATQDSSSTMLPSVILDNLDILNLTGRYQSDPDGIIGDIDIQAFNLQAPKIDLANNLVKVTYLGMKDSKIALDMIVSDVDSVSLETKITEDQFTSIWPEWEVAVAKIQFQKNEITYLVNGSKPVEKVFTPDAMVIRQFNLDGDNLYLDKKTAGVTLNKLSFKEGSGLEVDEFNFKLSLDDQHMKVDNLEFSAMDTRMSGHLEIKYQGIHSLLESPEMATLNLNVSKVILDPDMLFLFQPELRNNEYIRTLRQKPLSGNLVVKGLVSSLQISEMGIHWGNQTSAFASGRLNDVTEPDRLSFDFPTILIKTTRNDISNFVPEDSLGIRLPEEFRLTALLLGQPDDISTDAILQTSQGRLSLQGNYQNADAISFDVNIAAEMLQLDSLFQTDQFGPLSMTVTASGSGANLNTVDASFNSRLDEFVYNDYPIKDWVVNGSLVKGSGQIISTYQDNNLNAEIDANIELDSVAPSMEALIQIKDADLAALGLMNKSVKIAFDAKTQIKGNTEELNASMTIDNGTVLFEDKSYKIGALLADVHTAPDSTSLKVDNEMLDFTLHSNSAPKGIRDAIIRHVKSYVSDSIQVLDSMQPYVHLFMEASLSESPVISEVFLPGLSDMDTLKMKIDFHEKEKDLKANIKIPFLNYAGNKIDSVALSAYSDNDIFHVDMGLKEIDAGFITINKTSFTNEIKNQTMHSHFKSMYKDKDLIHVKTTASQNNDSLQIHLDPSDLVFDGKEWHIPSNNKISITREKILFRNFTMESGEQKLTINDNPGLEDLSIDFQMFKIENLISYLNPDSLLATGFVNGTVTLQEPLGNAGLIADLKINDLHIKEIDMGNLHLYGETEDAKDYSMHLIMKGGPMEMETDIVYRAMETSSDLDLSMSIDRLSMSVIESFSSGTINNSSGYISGDLNAGGSFENLIYSGSLNFHETSITPTELNTPFHMGDQKIQFDNKGVNLKNFSITDEDGNAFTLNGVILTSDIANPSFDLTMKATDFQILNASKEDNDLFYGKASFDASATLTGDLNLPALDLNLKVGSKTDVTYIMPQGEAALNKRDGIVEFVNKEEPATKLTEGKKESIIIKGYDIQAIVSVDRKALFKVIISEETGDHFQISGDGDLSFTVDPVGRTSLSGIYNLEDGHYQMNLYNLVTRRFDIAKGSTVSWSGDPFDAKIDVRAIYKTETSAASLMNNQTSGAKASVQNQYQRKLPFLVYLNVNGQLSEPRLSFNLDMPEEAQGMMGGQVYSRIQQINGEEQELNKQVFSLLVLSRFYPSSGSDGSSGGIASIARDNLNQALSDQLNLFSDKLLGETGLELNFDLESYTDYQGSSAQNRTELDIAAQKKFLDNRLIVKVGSEVDIEGSNKDPNNSNPLIGNVSVEYLLTERGNFRVKGFRKNVYENVIDGQTIVSGLALIFTKEFNKFDELWRSLIPENHEGNQTSKSQ